MVTSPIGNRPSNTSPHSSVPSNVSIASRELPTPETLEAYIAVKHQPYAVEYFGVKDIADLPTYNKWAEIVDEYVSDEIRSRGLKDSLEVYRQIVDSITSQMGLDTNTVGNIKLRRIGQWVRDVIRPMRRIQFVKDRILGHV